MQSQSPMMFDLQPSAAAPKRVIRTTYTPFDPLEDALAPSNMWRVIYDCALPAGRKIAENETNHVCT